MSTSGKFDTSTKTKLTTKFGKILKVTSYESEGQEFVEYRIKPKCSYCGGDVGCVCYHDDNSDEPYDAAIRGLQTGWICEKVDCIITYLKENNPEHYTELTKEFGDDKLSIVEYLQEQMCEDNSEIFCEV
jgi:hypothetical protein